MFLLAVFSGNFQKFRLTFKSNWIMETPLKLQRLPVGFWGQFKVLLKPTMAKGCISGGFASLPSYVCPPHQAWQEGRVWAPLTEGGRLMGPRRRRAFCGPSGALPCLLSKDMAESKGWWIWLGFGGCWVASLVDPSLALACFLCFLVLVLFFHGVLNWFQGGLFLFCLSWAFEEEPKGPKGAFIVFLPQSCCKVHFSRLNTKTLSPTSLKIL